MVSFTAASGSHQSVNGYGGMHMEGWNANWFFWLEKKSSTPLPLATRIAALIDYSKSVKHFALSEYTSNGRSLRAIINRF